MDRDFYLHFLKSNWSYRDELIWWSHTASEWCSRDFVTWLKDKVLRQCITSLPLKPKRQTFQFTQHHLLATPMWTVIFKVISLRSDLLSLKQRSLSKCFLRVLHVTDTHVLHDLSDKRASRQWGIAYRVHTRPLLFPLQHPGKGGERHENQESGSYPGKRSYNNSSFYPAFEHIYTFSTANRRN